MLPPPAPPINPSIPVSPTIASVQGNQGGSSSSGPAAPDSSKTLAFYTVRQFNILTIPGEINEPLLVDSGAALRVCHPRFGDDYPLEPLTDDLWNL